MKDHSRYTCVNCASKVQVGSFHEKEWYCYWCYQQLNLSKPWQSPPPYIPSTTTPSNVTKYKKMQAVIEEIPCDNKLDHDIKPIERKEDEQQTL